MGRTGKRILGLGVFLAATTCLTGVAFAQVTPPPLHTNLDSNGVDLTSGAFHVVTPTIAIGTPGAGGLSYSRHYDSNGSLWRDDYQGVINSSAPTSYADGTIFTVSLGSVV